jgi:DNA-binding GntR family transcriptional regulator
MEPSLPHRRSPGLRAYDALRTAVLSGDLPAGRIDIQKVASRIGVSSTPVREALARMASEQLIAFTPGQGYAIAHLTAGALCDLYVWSDRVIRLAFDLSCEQGDNPALRQGMAPADPGSAAAYAQGVSSLFDDIAQASGNAECISKIAESNARLFRARTVEWRVLTDAVAELSQLVLHWSSGGTSELSDRIRAYFQRRIEHCETIAATLSQLGAEEA